MAEPCWGFREQGPDKVQWQSPVGGSGNKALTKYSGRALLGVYGTSLTEYNGRALLGVYGTSLTEYNGRALLGVQGTSPDKVQWQSLAGSAEDKAPAAYSGNSPVKGMGDMAGWEHRD